MGDAVPTEMTSGRATTSTRSRTSGLLLALGLVVVAAAGALLLGAGADAAPTCTKNFTGASGGAWENGANWTPSGVPTASDYACSTAAKSIVLSSGLQSVDGVQLLGSLTAQGGELHTGASASSFASLTLAGGTVSGSASITGALDWQSGGFTGAGTTTLAPGAVTTVSMSTYHAVATGHVLANQGSFTWNDGYLNICASSSLQNSGTLTLNNPGYSIGSYPCGTNGSIANQPAGTITATAANVGTIDSPFLNGGTISVPSGAAVQVTALLNVTGSGGSEINGGTYQVACSL